MYAFILLAVVVAGLLWMIFGDFLSGRSGRQTASSASNATVEQEKNNFKAIANKYKTIEEVQDALRAAGLESSNLIIGIDYTKSNTWTGKNTFGGKCLHELNRTYMNPYQTVIHVIGRTLQAFDDDQKIPVFGFGDALTKDKDVFPFYPNKPAFGLQDVLNRYTHITPGIQLAGPTSFVPIIKEAIKIVQQDKSYHILVIVADGQVTSMEPNRQVIVEASNYPLSIILVGVGDGPWEAMHEFDDGLPARKFDNFQFVEFHEIMSQCGGNESAFATMALMEIPKQYKEIKKLGLL